MASKKKANKNQAAYIREGRAAAHGELVNESVHVFVDDQNLFWGLLNSGQERSYRVDFGRLLTEASKNKDGQARFVKSAYIAGVIPDDDSFWRVAEAQGFTVRRGYLSGSGGGGLRSKQDDAYLVTEITSALYENPGPSTIVLVAGDADYVPPLIRANDKKWRVEVAFIERGLSSSLDPVSHLFRTINVASIQYIPGHK
ncbi:NYN domain-containing protein [Chromobacterium violaceum]|uniref:NYN domain n=1 Tax=Chromobacterium violaceum TaxID=536 RepID=A0AAX2M813_CHRVL|nr:NYN domain-containing protein [Chromobacterium violaceum]OLZ77239.1 NYN domain-containing protein [Chromobacterium violaceum]STB63818.1 NYN domain [Chromobacterium violaceum]SUX32395.1 NYN domain [Chromobacterium violaceum]